MSIETYGDIHRRELAEKQREIDMLVDLLREGRNQSYGVMGIGTEKLRALEAWFAKVDAILGSPSNPDCDHAFERMESSPGRICTKCGHAVLAK